MIETIQPRDQAGPESPASEALQCIPATILIVRANRGFEQFRHAALVDYV
jgi:hypothetical protein